MKRLAMIPVLLLAGLLAQAPQPIPPYPGDDNPGHDGQPMHCQNYTDRHLPNCECRRDCSKERNEDNKCKVYCRPKACKCNHGCET